MSICPAGFAERQMEGICVLGGPWEYQSSEMPIHVSLHGRAKDPSAPANPTALAPSFQTVNASTFRPAYRCRVAAGLVCE